MPKLVRFLIGHAALGFAIAFAAVTLMMIANVANLRTLIMESEGGLLALCLLTFFLGLTLASAQMGIAVIMLKDGGRGPDIRRGS